MVRNFFRNAYGIFLYFHQNIPHFDNKRQLLHDGQEKTRKVQQERLSSRTYTPRCFTVSSWLSTAVGFSSFPNVSSCTSATPLMMSVAVANETLGKRRGSNGPRLTSPEVVSRY